MKFKEYTKANIHKVKNTRVIPDRYFYVYRITNKETSMHYYGSRVSVKPPKEDLGIVYFSSSYNKDFMDAQKSNSSSFKYKVVKLCTTNVEKQLFESYLHAKFNVGVNSVFYNMVKQTVEGFDSTGNKFNLGRKLSQETKDKLKIISSSRVIADSTREKHRLNALARTKEENLMRGAPMKGRKASDSTKELLSIINTGSSNHAAKKVTIFDDKDNIVIVSIGTFKKDCETNDFPWARLRQAKNGKKLYVKSDGTTSKNMLESSRKFIGWHITCE